MSYLGVPPFGQTIRTITELTATAGQTTFTPSGGYLPGYIDVFLNGVSLDSSDFTASNGSTVVLTSAAALNDELKTIAYWPVSLTDTYRKGEVDAGFIAKTAATGAALMPVGTTAQRPASPAVGMVRFNTDLNYLEEFRSGQWFPLSAVLVAEGGTVTTQTIGGVNYRIHTFTTSGTFTVLSGQGLLDYLIVGGGGGGGGGRHSAGAGAGGLRQGTLTAGVQSYAVVVGAGGASSLSVQATNGSSSSALGVSAVGGGRGGSHGLSSDSNASAEPGGSGGSGGGSAHTAGLAPGSGTSGQGFGGSRAVLNRSLGPSGGGAGSAGVTSGFGGENDVNGAGDAGGAGVQVNIDGNNFFYAGGGGGGASPNADTANSNWNGGNGGIGGGGGGASSAFNGSGGTGGGSARNAGGNGLRTRTFNACNGGSGGANTGGGGGAAAGWSAAGNGTGGNGGSGIVIIRYAI